MKLHGGEFVEADLVKIGDAFEWETPPQLGDVVMLNSGGPAMWVAGVDGNYRLCGDATGKSTFEMRFDYRLLRPAT